MIYCSFFNIAGNHRLLEAMYVDAAAGERYETVAWARLSNARKQLICPALVHQYIGLDK